MYGYVYSGHISNIHAYFGVQLTLYEYTHVHQYTVQVHVRCMCQLAMHGVSLQSTSAEETSEETDGGQPVSTQANEVRLVA